MGLFDVGSLRSRRSAARDVAQDRQLSMDNIYERSQDTQRSSISNRSVSLGLPAPNRSLTPRRSVSGLASSAARQSKMERMMGAGVPDVHVLPRHQRQTGAPLSEAHSSHHGLNNYQQRERGSFSQSVADMNTSMSSGSSTTFTDVAQIDCPVCLEPLSHRLAGEKPHVVPTCGHALHNACFVAIYGIPEAVLATQQGGRTQAARSSTGPPGMCGVCRRPILLGGADHTGKSHKLAGIASSISLAETAVPRSSTANDNAHQDDSLFLPPSSRMAATSSASSVLSSNSIVQTRPTLRPKPEFATIYCKREENTPSKINVVSVLTVAVTSRRAPTDSNEHTLDTFTEEYEPSKVDEDDSFSDDLKRSGYDDQAHAQPLTSEGNVLNNGLLSDADTTKAILDDLQSRVADWKGHSIEHFGPLVLHNVLNIRQQSVVREFHVYLFQEALLCVTEDKTKTTGRLEQPDTGKPPLKLKGRIYLRHISSVSDSSTADQHSISITMDDESLDQFVLCFQETTTLSLWQSHLNALIDPARTKDSKVTDFLSAETRSSLASGAKGPMSASAVSRNNSAAASLLSGKSGSPLLQNRYPNRFSNVSSQPSLGSGISRSDALPLYQQWSSSGGLDPRLSPPHMLPHTSLDLVLMISIPSVLTDYVSGSINSSAAVKLRLIRSTLDFVVHNLGPQDRLCLITFTVGVDGEVRRTGLLNPQRESSRQLLERFIQDIGRPWGEEESDGFSVDLSVLGGSSDRVDSVTAVNVGLDVVLGRQSKNGVTGMMLINDMSDGPKRNQMDLVLARAEAANAAIHCLGYGKTHDPSSLWLISNHTRGSYTFVREWHQLRECVAGCVGSMMSVALTDAKVHISVPEDNHFRIRKIAGLPGAIISSTGKHVDIELGELKFGEARDLLIELELDLANLLPKLTAGRSETKPSSGIGYSIELGSATDDFMQRMGLEDLSLADSDGTDGGYMDQLVEEIGVFEADISFKDPAAGTTTCRLTNPGILTLEIDTHNMDPLSKGLPGLAALVADPTVTRRRLEVLVSEMITRSLLLVSRKNYGQALRVMMETRRIVDTVVQALNGTGPGQGKRRSTPTHSYRRTQRDTANQHTITSLLAMMNDLDTLCESLEPQNRATFERDGRNFGAQQAMILRDQKAWTTRSDTEHLYFGQDNAAALVAWSASYASRQ